MGRFVVVFGPLSSYTRNRTGTFARVVDSVSTSATGGSATGTDTLRHKGNGDYDVVLSVTDAAGNVTTQSKTVTLG